ncbi:MAG: hypothetical protein E7108_07375 [Bacteroidales bacterium]|jgi:5-methylcytosine-specific restriction enzyme subunit McrC|nr:hypothetical protein [Bacteroidales bacterium]
MQIINTIEQCNRVLDGNYIPLLGHSDSFVRKMQGRGESDAFCYCIEKQAEGFLLKTSYFVGIDWVTDDVVVQVRPKVEGEEDYIDYLRMLTEALKEPENTEHLDGLLTIDFNAKPIPLEEKENMLSPFIVAQFLLVLKKAVRKGLRQSYYLVSANLNSKIKGKILIGKNVITNLSCGNRIDHFCQYQEYGINSEENKILKKALSLSSHILSTYRGGLDVSTLKKTIAHIYPYFRGVGDDYDLTKVDSFKANPIFKDYYKALEYGRLILKRSAYGFNRSAKHIDSTPPYWIDMSKLFELYVYKELRRLYPIPGEVIYHMHAHWRELDYLLNPKNGTPMVIDAKYKPRYHSKEPEIEDIRQISAYARMEDVYNKLHLSEDRTIDCLIVYANQECPPSIPEKLDNLQMTKVKGYSKFHKVGISLPVRE